MSSLLPSALSGGRLLAAPVLALSAWLGYDPVLLFWLILGAALSDYLDGLAARRLHMSTFGGKVLDFLADKMFLTVALLVLMKQGRIEPLAATVLISYHLLVLAAMTVVSWGTGRPVVVIPTSEKLVVALSFATAAASAGEAAFPGKGVFSALADTACIIAVCSVVFGSIGYLRLIRRVLARYSR
jgi:phosphatidylglycerophosphate synthase